MTEAARTVIRDRIEDIIWRTLEGQTQRFGWVDRENATIDVSGIELNMNDVADAVLELFDRGGVNADLTLRQYMNTAGWW